MFEFLLKKVYNYIILDPDNNMDGIILLNDTFNINTLSSDLYFSKMDAIKDNFERCINHQTSDDYIFDRIIELI